MALIQCKGCGHMISDKAQKCPKCGTPTVVEKQATNESAPPVDEIFQTSTPKRKQSSGNSILYVLLGILVVALIVLGVVVWKKFLPTSTTSERPAVTTKVDTTVVKDETTTSASQNNDVDESQSFDSLDDETVSLSESDYSSELTFNTFAQRERDASSNAVYFPMFGQDEIRRNLKKKGFELTSSTTERRLDVYGEDYYTAKIENYSITKDGLTTTVKVDEDHLVEIHFPNQKDVEDFTESVRSSGMLRTSDGYKSTDQVYWYQTLVNINGRVVTVSVSGEL